MLADLTVRYEISSACANLLIAARELDAIDQVRAGLLDAVRNRLARILDGCVPQAEPLGSWTMPPAGPEKAAPMPLARRVSIDGFTLPTKPNLDPHHDLPYEPAPENPHFELTPEDQAAWAAMLASCEADRSLRVVRFPGVIDPDLAQQLAAGAVHEGGQS